MILVIGYEGYGGRSANPAEMVVKALHGTQVSNMPVEGRALPVVYAGLGERISRLVNEVRPRAMVCLGLWPGEPVIRLERVAVNIADFEIPDNAGALAHGPLDPAGPDALMATLPIRAIQDALLDRGIPTRLSGSAGTFLCNATLYHALAACGRLSPPPPCGFIHLPYLPEQVAGLIRDTRTERRLELHQRSDLASMALATMIEGVRVAIETTLAARP
jgi:pyroglutamyl-peptidase